MTGGGLTLRDLANRFLTLKELQAAGEEIAHRTFQDHHTSCARILQSFGRLRSVADIATDDFERYRAELTKSLAPTTCHLEMQRCRSLFNYAYQAGLIDRPMRFGPGFRSLSNKAARRLKQQRPAKMFEAVEIRAMCEAASIPFRAMILLAINCGFGNHDCACLPKSAVDLETGWIDFPRPKTGVERRCPLWPETTEAVRKAIAVRPEPKDSAHAGLVFVTKQGNKWVRPQGNGWSDAVANICTELLQKLDLKRPGHSFYALRHTFATVADGARDPVVVSSIMGHADGSMAGVYRERIEDDRLQVVTEHVRQWVFDTKETE